jgi:hypothetical protein
MNDRLRRVRTRFGPEARFDLPAVPFRAAAPSQLELLRDRLLQPLLQGAGQPDQNAALRRAANDAIALAWATPYPLLFFPALLEEKAALALAQQQRQDRIRQRSLKLAFEVA